MILFHGSKNGIKGEIEPISRKECDFKNLKGHSFEINRDWYLYIAYNRIPEKISRYKNVFNYGVQFVAKTKAACKCIKILDSELLSNDTRNANNNEVQHRLESIKDVVEQVKTRYRKSDSKFFDEILEEM